MQITVFRTHHGGLIKTDQNYLFPFSDGELVKQNKAKMYISMVCSRSRENKPSQLAVHH